MDKYFSKFPTTYYSNTLCRDLTRRVSINQNADVQGTLDVFYPYTITDFLRPDHVAEYYYEDAELDWMVFHANQIQDPYFEWYLNPMQFEVLIRDKYGSPEVAQRSIKFWRSNWASDDQEITVSYYENTLEPEWRQYYQPRWGQGTRILSYVRKPLDMIVNTNKIVSYAVSYASNTDFIVGEPVDFINITSAVGQGMVTTSNATHLVIQSTVDDITANSSLTKTITGLSSGASATSNSMSTIVTNLTDNELVFWTPVTLYDYETEINEQKKEVYLVGAGPHSMISQQVRKALQDNVDKLTGLTTD